jgi:hypothetical protein
MAIGFFILILGIRMYVSKLTSNDEYIIAFGVFALTAIVCGIWMRLRIILGTTGALIIVSIVSMLIFLVEFISRSPNKDMFQLIIFSVTSVVLFTEGATIYKENK